MDALLKLLESVEKSSDKKSLVFRATNIFFLNDPQEFIYGQIVLMNVLKEIEYDQNVDDSLRISSVFSRHHEKTEEEWSKILLDGIHDQNESPYVISFSRNMDSLPMWLNYGDNGKGVCLAFTEYRYRILGNIINPSNLEDIKVETYDSLGTYDVNYDEGWGKDKNNILRKHIVNIYNYYLKESKSTHHNNLLELQIGTLRAFTEVIAPYIKTKQYESEREVRLAKTLSKDKKGNVFELQFGCNSKGHLIPYIDIEIPLKQLDCVRIGPLADKELSIKVIKMMRKKYNVSFDVEVSDIKYRNY